MVCHNYDTRSRKIDILAGSAVILERQREETPKIAAVVAFDLHFADVFRIYLSRCVKRCNLQYVSGIIIRGNALYHVGSKIFYDYRTFLVGGKTLLNIDYWEQAVYWEQGSLRIVLRGIHKYRAAREIK